MIIGVCGSRTFTDQERLNTELEALHPTAIVSGGAKGADAMARDFAVAHGLPITEYKPDYKQHGRGAPFVRNRQIVEASDMLIAFWDGISAGTKYTVEYAQKSGKTVKIISP